MQYIPFTLLRVLSVCFMAFVIYGSLVPLEYVYIPFEVAKTQFNDISFLSFGMASRADWAANFLLFIPIGFFMTGASWSKSIGIRLLASVSIVFFCLCLTMGIEFTQLYFPDRTTSQYDIQAETIGGIVGIAIWWVYGEKLSLFYHQLGQAKGVVELAGKVLFIYLLILIGYNILPLDLTISPVEIYNKWKSGAINLTPFRTYKDNFADQFYEFITDIIIWLPVSILYRLSGKTLVKSFTRTLCVALVLEFMQLFVYSRTSDITDLVTASVGAIAGLYLVLLFESKYKARPIRQENTGIASDQRFSSKAFQIMGIILSFTLLVVIFWYPFAFSFESSVIKPRIAGFFDTPLKVYYFGSEYRAINEVFRKAIFFIPLAVFIAWYRQASVSGILKAAPNWLIYGLLLIPPFFIEFGQLLLPEKHAQIDDVFFEWMGCLIGFQGFNFISRRLKPDDAGRPDDDEVSDELDITQPNDEPVVFKTDEHRPGLTSRFETEITAPINDQPIFPALGLSAVFWLLIIFLSPVISPVMHEDLHASIHFLTTWTSYGNSISIYWALCLTTLFLITSLCSATTRSRVSIAVVVWVLLTILVVTLSIFIESITWLKLMASTAIGFGLSLILSSLLLKIKQPKRIYINSFILLFVIALPIDSSNNAEALLLSGDWSEVSERIYYLLKSLILYFPLGIMVAIIGTERVVENIVLSLALSFCLICLPLLAAAPGIALLNILALPLGVNFGIWLMQGKRLEYA